MDFSQLSGLAAAKKQIDPIKIFEGLPNLPDTPNDIWRGQTEALESWHQSRNKNDVLIELNTGAGKTLVGVLIAQSLVNEGVQNVIYVCATIDLVYQTSAEADRIGIQHTVRVGSSYSNDLFESGKSFCVTTYHALFNGLSSIRRKYFPEAIIFDDAHVSEQVLRSSLTLSFSQYSHPALFSDVVALFDDHFRDLERHGEFLHAIDSTHAKIVMAAPSGVIGKRSQLLDVLRRHDVEDDDDLKYAFNHLKDRLDRCALFFGHGVCEITPPFLPSLSMDCLERPIRRVYLSATLRHKTDFVRAYGRLPDVCISPKNDAGNGERLVLLGRGLSEDLDESLVKKVSANNKVLIAVPNYASSERWSGLATPPEPREFSEKLQNFRTANSGVFVLVQRVDGIDLPHNTCRVMVLDGIPSGGSLLERFQWEFLNMRNMVASKVANRLAQLFGRINRGRNDYGVFLIAGNELNVWLNNDRNLALLPELLQQQIKLGVMVQEGMGVSTGDKVAEITSAVIGRNPSWLKFYGDNIVKGGLDESDSHRATEIEDRLTNAALSEAAYAKAMWEGRPEQACRELEGTLEETLRADTPLAGWHNVWLAAAYEKSGDMDSASQAYERANSRLGSNVYLPHYRRADKVQDEPLNSFGESLNCLVGPTSEDGFRRERLKLEKDLYALNGGTPSQVEASVRELGELLGFTSTRPDNDLGTGPDVLWIDTENSQCLAFELKTDKGPTSVISKKDVGQGHQHVQWVADNYPGHGLLGLVYVSDAGKCDPTASPTDEMYLAPLSVFLQLKMSAFALINDLRDCLPIERYSAIVDASSEDRWTITNIAEGFYGVRLKGLQK